MQHPDFTASIVTDKTAMEVFNAVTNPRAWWSEEITGTTNKTDGIFDYHFEEVHRCKVKVTQLIPGKYVEWLILENNFNFTSDKTEWVNTKVVFDIATAGHKTTLTFTHIGLVPEYECYDACQAGWTFYILTSLQQYINTGSGSPNKTGAPQTEMEERLLN